MVAAATDVSPFLLCILFTVSTYGGYSASSDHQARMFNMTAYGV